MAKQTITRRQKNISRLLRERREAYPEKLKATRRMPRQKRKGGVKMSGSKYSFSNPLTAEVTKS